jgi:hypothetical protein
MSKLPAHSLQSPNGDTPSTHEEWVIARLKERMALVESGKAVFISHEEVVRTARESLISRLKKHAESNS